MYWKINLLHISLTRHNKDGKSGGYDQLLHQWSAAHGERGRVLQPQPRLLCQGGCRPHWDQGGDCGSTQTQSWKMSRIWRIYPCKIWFVDIGPCKRFDIFQLCSDKLAKFRDAKVKVAELNLWKGILQQNQLRCLHCNSSLILTSFKLSSTWKWQGFLQRRRLRCLHRHRGQRWWAAGQKCQCGELKMQIWM